MTTNLLPNGEANASINSSIAYAGIDKNAGTAWGTGANPLPVWWQYMFADAKIITKYKITPNGAFTPQTWTFLGSNDNSTWILLDAQTNQTAWSTTNQYSIPNMTAYKYYRLNFTAMNSTAVSIIEVEMLEQGEPTISAHWQTVSTTLPSFETFKSDGINNLSILNRKSTTFINTMDGNGIFGSGKTFKKSVDLKNLFEITNIKVE
ncbi:F5/8 type C domain protein [compost metagenome]